MVPEGARGSPAWQIGDWRVDPSTGEIDGPAGSARLEPKLIELLGLLIEAGGAVVPHEQIMARLWPGMILGEDTLARSVSRLRRALGDSAREPRYIETLPKRGYRLVARVHTTSGEDAADSIEPGPAAPANGAERRSMRLIWPLLLALLLAAAVWLAGWGLPTSPPEPPLAAPPEQALIARADDHYAQYEYPDNEAALQLYEKVLALRPDDPQALAGLSNALVQKAMRWPDEGSSDSGYTRLSDALAAGHLAQPAQQRLLARARVLAERAVERDPRSTGALRALGLVASAQSDLDTALETYRSALEIDPQAWPVLINLGELMEIRGDSAEALALYERAHTAMEAAYQREPARIRGWDAALGVSIGDRYRAQGQSGEAEAWYRRVLRTSPLHPGATRALAKLLIQQGETAKAEALCASLREADATEPCLPAVPSSESLKPD